MIVPKTCILCKKSFLAEPGRLPPTCMQLPQWMTSEICPNCEARLRKNAEEAYDQGASS